MPNIVPVDFKSRERQLEEMIKREEAKYQEALSLHAEYMKELSARNLSSLMEEMNTLYEKLNEPFPYSHMRSNAKEQANFRFSEPEPEPKKKERKRAPKRSDSKSKELKSIYRKCIILCHPDKNKKIDPKRAAEYMELIQRAYTNKNYEKLLAYYSALKESGGRVVVVEVSLLEDQLKRVVVRNTLFFKDPLIKGIIKKGANAMAEKAIYEIKEHIAELKLVLRRGNFFYSL